MPEVAGKSVTFRKKLPADKWWPLLPKLAKLQEAGAGGALTVLDFPTLCEIVSGSVEAWEFDGDPTDAAAVGALDAFSELMPLVMAISKMIGERASLGEAASGPT